MPSKEKGIWKVRHTVTGLFSTGDNRDFCSETGRDRGWSEGGKAWNRLNKATTHVLCNKRHYDIMGDKVEVVIGKSFSIKEETKAIYEQRGILVRSKNAANPQEKIGISSVRNADQI